MQVGSRPTRDRGMTLAPLVDSPRHSNHHHLTKRRVPRCHRLHVRRKGAGTVYRDTLGSERRKLFVVSLHFPGVFLGPPESFCTEG